MKNNFFISLICCFALIVIACTNEPIAPEPIESETLEATESISSRNVGATQISGIGNFTDPGFDLQGADYALILDGDLVGYLYVFVEDYECSPSGTYRESGTERFVGSYNGEHGTFETNYRFEAKFEGCSEGFPLGAEIFGRCQHPIQNGSGTDVFEGVTGRLNFKDDIETGEFPYRGHLRF